MSAIKATMSFASECSECEEEFDYALHEDYKQKPKEIEEKKMDEVDEPPHKRAKQVSTSSGSSKVSDNPNPEPLNEDYKQKTKVARRPAAKEASGKLYESLSGR